ncbi:MAG: hypothetical protein KFKLKKLM_02450 [Flavobacteriales bacterium]|nr:hypothetical protein [Flavobacteriales bacterium]
MPIFQVGKDFETAERIGAVGTFQVDTLLDEDDNDVSDKIDVGIHFHDNEHLKEYLSKIFDIPLIDIDIEEL